MKLLLPMAQGLEEDNQGHQLTDAIAVKMVWILTPLSAQYLVPQIPQVSFLLAGCRKLMLLGDF